MSRLDARWRARLPDRAFAYINSRGERQLPIHDEAHLRNALARFNQVAFENDASRERARKRLPNAAKKYGIGFITAGYKMYREMDMGFWLEKTEAALREPGPRAGR